MSKKTSDLLFGISFVAWIISLLIEIIFLPVEGHYVARAVLFNIVIGFVFVIWITGTE